MRRFYIPAADPAWRRQVLWALVSELAFFVAVLAVAGALEQSPALLDAHGVQQFLRQLDQAFAPFGALHPWYRLGWAIFLHNARALLVLALGSALCATLAAVARLRGLALAALVLALGGTALFWVVNVATAGVVVAAVARTAGVTPLLVWLTLLPHGVFELFALSWAMVLPVRLAWTWSATQSAGRAARDLASALWPGVAVALAVLALAATIESTVSPRVLHALVPGSTHSLPQTATNL